MAGLELTFLGGLGEIGMNCMLLSGPEGSVIIDVGVMFPRDLGSPEYMLPDLNFLEDRADSIHGIVVTHAHEDHLGGIPYLLARMDVPVYGPSFALGLLREKLAEREMLDARLIPVFPRQNLTLAGFEFEFVRVTHSIPDALAVVIRTSEGTILHTGDFRIDSAPAWGEPFQFEAFQRLADEGVLLMMADSTNIFTPGHTVPEREVVANIEELCRDWKGRILLTMFASNIQRLGLVAQMAQRLGRSLCLMGRSLHTYLRVATATGQAPFRDEDTLDPHRLDGVPDEELLIVLTGSQGEPRATLAKLASDEHPDVTIREGDMVIFSSRIIPGNELDIGRMCNGLTRMGARVVTGEQYPVHTSGHAHRMELGQLLGVVRPQYFIPIHGEYRFLAEHARFAQERGGAETLVVENGDVVEVTREGIRPVGKEPLETLYVDGLLVGTEAELAIRERKKLLYNGAVVLDVRLERRGGGKMRAKVDVSLLGVPDPDGTLVARIVDNVETVVAEKGPRVAPGELKEEIASAARREVRRSQDRRPIVVSVVNEP